MRDREQINEMVKDYKCCIGCEMYNKYANRRCIDSNLPENCSICRERAEALYNAGYRKEKQTAKEILTDLYNNGKDYYTIDDLIEELADKYGVKIEE